LHRNRLAKIPVNPALKSQNPKRPGSEVDDGIWLVSFMQYDLGYVDLEQKTLQTIDNPFGAKV
jgi:hypothetical protein